MAKYLVTGGAGFIGTNLVKELVSGGHNVTVIDNYAAGRFPERVIPGVKYIEGDIRNQEDLKKCFVDGQDGIFHTAAIPRMPYSVEHPLETNDINAVGTLQVLLAAKENKVKRVIYSASSSAYGDQKITPFVETMRPKPMSPYGLQKFIGEEYCRLFFELYGLETVSLRYFNVYGSLMDPKGAYALVIGLFLDQKRKGQPLTICGDGEYLRDYTNVKDIVHANILAMRSDKVGHGEVLNIGNGKPYTVNELAKFIGGEVQYIAPRPGDPRVTEADYSLAKKLIGWEPTIDLKEGIEHLKAEWKID